MFRAIIKTVIVTHLHMGVAFIHAILVNSYWCVCVQVIFQGTSSPTLTTYGNEVEVINIPDTLVPVLVRSQDDVALSLADKQNDILRKRADLIRYNIISGQ